MRRIGAAITAALVGCWAVAFVAAQGEVLGETRVCQAPPGMLGVVVSQSNMHVAWSVRVDGGEAVVINGVQGTRHDAVSPVPSMSDDGEHVAYVARDGGSWSVVMDGTNSASYDEVAPSSLLVSWDGKHVAFAARRGVQWLVVVDGAETQPYDSVMADTLRHGVRGNLEFVAVRDDAVLLVSVPFGEVRDTPSRMALMAEGRPRPPAPSRDTAGDGDDGSIGECPQGGAHDLYVDEQNRARCRKCGRYCEDTREDE